MITLDQFWKGPDAVRRDLAYPDDITPAIRNNAEHTVSLANRFIARYEAATGKTVSSVNSGWRPPSVNEATANAAIGSKHLQGLAVDLYDPAGDLDRWLLTDAGIQALVDIGLWAEHPGWTDGWSHLQTVPAGIPPRPDVRVFIPSAKPPQTMIYGMAPVFLPVV